MRAVMHFLHVLYFPTLYRQKVYVREGIGRCVLFTQRFRRKGYAHLMVYAWRDEEYTKPIPIHYIIPTELATLLSASSSDTFLVTATAMSMKRVQHLEEGL